MNEMPTAYLHDERKARKEHKCCECRGAIAAGEIYHVHSGIWDGEPSSFKVCVDCHALREKIDKGLALDEQTAFTFLSDSVFESDNLEFIKAFLMIKEKRHAPIKFWMTERFDEITEEKEHQLPPEELFDEQTNHSGNQ